MIEIHMEQPSNHLRMISIPQVRDGDFRVGITNDDPHKLRHKLPSYLRLGRDEETGFQGKHLPAKLDCEVMVSDQPFYPEFHVEGKKILAVRRPRILLQPPAFICKRQPYSEVVQLAA